MLRIKVLISIFIIASGLIAVSSCKRDRTMDLVLTVKMMADTTIVVPYAKVTLEKQDVLIEGFTDGKGEFRHTFSLPIQLDIRVSKDTLYGIGIVNIYEIGDDITQSVYIY